MTSVEILGKWIEIAKRCRMYRRVNQFWLLRDFAEQGVWSERFYRKHAQEALKILNELDDSKQEVKKIIQAMSPLIKKWMK